jgi:membrane-bound serine protease (ClpP class)
VFAAVGTLSVFVLGVAFLVVNSQRRKATLGFDGLVGEVGEVRERLDLKGKVFVHGEVWNAEGAEQIEPGDRIEVVGYDRMILKVKRATES